MSYYDRVDHAEEPSSRVKVVQLDPEGCGCTECIIGEYRPLDQASDAELLACARGEISNATGANLDEQPDGTVRVWYGQRVEALHPEDCGCLDCITGAARPVDMASDAQLTACAEGRLRNSTGLTAEQLLARRIWA